MPQSRQLRWHLLEDSTLNPKRVASNEVPIAKLLAQRDMLVLVSSTIALAQTNRHEKVVVVLKSTSKADEGHPSESLRVGFSGRRFLPRLHASPTAFRDCY